MAEKSREGWDRWKNTWTMSCFTEGENGLQWLGFSIYGTHTIVGTWPPSSVTQGSLISFQVQWVTEALRLRFPISIFISKKKTTTQIQDFVQGARVREKNSSCFSFRLNVPNFVVIMWLRPGYYNLFKLVDFLGKRNTVASGSPRQEPQKIWNLFQYK